ncbi:hypothetical protein DAEQUDRAFT_242468 [Daedalea quercina L-15889]|uniref:Uncharacterized protein n=1 Tax=Daedalea quercina L-15889 TaxID=1314783 RepID=A0A165QRQ8_9APHY|nr:hypothetical protein DAEQUDRAFT_242468 [Daedalea quercina L-15889]
MRLGIETIRRTVLELSRFYTQVQPYVTYFHWFRSDMNLFLTLARIMVPAAAGTVMALAGFVLSILSAIAHAIVSAFLGLPLEEPHPRVEPKLLVPTLHSRNASTASLYSVILSQDSDSIAQTTSETVSSRPQSNPLGEQEVPADDPSSPATPASQSSSQSTASGSNILQISRDAFNRGHLPIRRIASQIQEDCRKRRPVRKSTSPPTISVSLPPPLTPIPSAEPSTPSLFEQQSTVPNDSGRESPQPKVVRSVTPPASSTCPPPLPSRVPS